MTVAIAILLIIAGVCLLGAARLIAVGIRRRKSRAGIGGIVLAFLGIGVIAASWWINGKPSIVSGSATASGSIRSLMKQLTAKTPEPSGRHGSMVPKPPEILPLDHCESFTLQRVMAKLRRWVSQRKPSPRSSGCQKTGCPRA